MHINPDHFLETDDGRVTTPERNRKAWELSYAALDEALAAATADTRLYVVIGPQGAGKSTWSRHRIRQERDAIIFDAILVQRSERQPILAAARRHGVPTVAVWLRTPLAACLSRNAARPSDELVPEQAIRNVFNAVEPPSAEEGFHQVLEVSSG